MNVPSRGPMYSIWRNNSRLGVLSQVRSVADNSGRSRGVSGVLIPDDPEMSFSPMNQSRLSFLPHAPIIQNLPRVVPESEMCVVTLPDGSEVKGVPLREVPMDALGVPKELVWEVRSDDSQVVYTDGIWVTCNEVEPCDGAAAQLAAMGLSPTAHQVVYVIITHASEWPQPE